MARRCFYVRIILNQECNLRCMWCHREGMERINIDTLNREEISFFVEVLRLAGFIKFKFLGGEPTLRKDFIDILSNICKIPKIDVSMVTNGSDLYERAQLYKNAGICRINVTLNSVSHDYFNKYIGDPKFLPLILSGVDNLIKIGMKPKLNFVYMKSKSDNELENVLTFANKRKIRVNLLNVLSSSNNAHKLESLHATVPELMTLISSLGIMKISYKKDLYSLPALIIKLNNGGLIELKHNEIGKLGLLESCWSCDLRDKCVEGIYAIRLTPEGKLRPCVLRNDNCFNIKSVAEGFNWNKDKVSDEVIKYMSKL